MAKQKGKGSGGGLILVAAALAAPLLVLAAVLGAQAGLWSRFFAFEVLTLSVGRYLALAGVAAAALCVVVALKDIGRRWPFAAVAVVAAGATLALFLMQQARFAIDAPIDVSTNAADPPGYSRLIMAQRQAEGAVAVSTPQGSGCPAAVSLPTQVSPKAAKDALERAGFKVVVATLFRAEGVHDGLWFGFTHDAVVRIRPGETDVRVTAREGVAQGDEACRMASRIVASLRSSSS